MVRVSCPDRGRSALWRARVERPGCADAHPTGYVCPAYRALTLAGVVVLEDVRCSSPPSGVRPGGQLHPNPRIGFDVTHPLSAIPACATSQKVCPSRPSHTGVQRGCPVRRPVVSSRASPGGGMPSFQAAKTIGLRRRCCSVWLAAEPPVGMTSEYSQRCPPESAATVLPGSRGPDRSAGVAFSSTRARVQGFCRRGQAACARPPRVAAGGCALRFRRQRTRSLSAVPARASARRSPWGVDALSGTVSEPAWRTKPTWYLLTTEDKMIPPAAQRAMSDRAGATVTEVAASHSVYVSQPAAVANLIEQAAAA